ncbi:major histocompatibility complex class I-related gene protein-like [Dromiciops gliroides]|uniref:major histocompatibility complex class I-related gene protein-like n=1 Tax=Dromiciops gliroides TaxID=33562 RepID=UPI001CC809FE|nr:major histocompatibility complex class I-related gene protein-like [Dromiciops gliroides]
MAKALLMCPPSPAAIKRNKVPKGPSQWTQSIGTERETTQQPGVAQDQADLLTSYRADPRDRSLKGQGSQEHTSVEGLGLEERKFRDWNPSYRITRKEVQHILETMNCGLLQMRTQRKKGPFVSWLFFLGMFALGKTQTVLHSLETQFTGLAITDNLPDIIISVWVDGQILFSYDTQSKELLIKLGWAYPPLKNRLIEKLKEHLQRGGENDLRRFCAYWMVSYNETWEIQTTQVTAFCELDEDIQVDSRMWVAFDGETVCQLDAQSEGWVTKKPEVTRFCNYLVDSVQWDRLLVEECPKFLKIVLELFHLKENEPPEVTVSRHDAPDGRTTLFCTARGFHPRPILLHWEKDGQMGVWGKESSSGTLPNGDATFYLQVIVELQPRDPGEGYACVVEHHELGVPAIYPAPRKVTRRKSWELSLGISATTILLLILAVAVIIWRKRDAWGHRTQEQHTEEGSGIFSLGAQALRRFQESKSAQTLLTGVNVSMTAEDQLLGLVACKRENNGSMEIPKCLSSPTPPLPKTSSLSDVCLGTMAL